MALHHKICHVLGGSFGLVHGDVNSVVLPHVVAFNAAAASDAIARVAIALSVPDPADALFDLAVTVEAPTSLARLGLDAASLRPAAQRVVDETSYNPRSVDAESVYRLLEDAWLGRRPTIARG